MKTPLNNKPEAHLVCLSAIPLGSRTAPTSKTWLRATLLALLVAAALCPANAQVSFTRILEGDVANDRGNFLGCAWGDYDNDGYVDLFVGNELGLTNRLYHNNGNGTFTRITTGKIVNEPADTSTPVWGDFDNDGDLDLFASNYGPPARDFFYRSEGNGTFTKITQGAWVTDSSAGVGAAWGDYDNDGFLDLYVANSQDQNDFLYHNNGDGTMTRIATGPVTTSGGMSTGCAWGDYDGDGDLDLFVANALGQKVFQFRNNGNGAFTRITAGAPVSAAGDYTGIALADYDNDGDLDLFVTDTQGGSNRLYRNDGPSGFVRITEGAVVDDGGSSIGAAWGDYDNDGYLDLFISNDFGENNFLYHNEGDGTFSRVIEDAVVNDGGRSWGCAWADYDNDGNLDLIVANGGYNSPPAPSGEACFLYHNEGGTNNWMILKLVGTASNRAAIGAKVRVLATIGGKSFWQLREISGGSGWCSQNDLRAHFGLGDATTVETVRIEWPSGIVQEMKNVAAKQFLTVTEQQNGITISPNLAVASTANGAVQLTLTGQTNLLYVFEASTNLVQWTKIAVRTNLTGSVELSDSAANKFPQRFYRTVAP
jgi:hypothetical protein